MKYFITLLILISGLSAYASSGIKNLYEIKHEQKTISTKKKKFWQRSRIGEDRSKSLENAEKYSPFLVFPNNGNSSAANVYFWKHEP